MTFDPFEGDLAVVSDDDDLVVGLVITADEVDVAIFFEEEWSEPTTDLQDIMYADNNVFTYVESDEDKTSVINRVSEGYLPDGSDLTLDYVLEGITPSN